MRKFLINLWITCKLFIEYILDTWTRRLFGPIDRDEESVFDRVVVITGANSGVGKTAALEFARRGAIVVLACRNLELGKIAVEEIQKESGSKQLVLLELDLAHLDSVTEFAKVVSRRFPEIHILVNNAGVSFDQPELLKTRDGFEMHMGTNHLGHFLLTNLLLPNLKRGAPSRVVVVASGCQLTHDLNLDDLMLEKHLNPTQHFFMASLPYNNSKYANSLFAQELGERLEGTGVTTYSLCPGIIRTNIWRNYTLFGKLCTTIANLITGVTVEQGCETILYCALSRNCAHQTGKVYKYCKLFRLANRRLDRTLAKGLWTESEQLVQLTKQKAMLGDL